MDYQRAPLLPSLDAAREPPASADDDDDERDDGPLAEAGVQALWRPRVRKVEGHAHSSLHGGGGGGGQQELPQEVRNTKV